jgi:hypothetical protein
MIAPRQTPVIAYPSRHCTEYGCGKCTAQARWDRRKKWRARRRTVRRNTGRK